MTNALYVILYLVRFVLLANFLFFHFWLIELFIQQPIRNINNLDSLILIFIMPGSGYHILRVCILNLQKWSYLSFKGLLFTDIIRYLNIDFSLRFTATKSISFLYNMPTYTSYPLRNNSIATIFSSIRP